MAQELENKNTLRETADDRQLVYVRYEDGDDEELDIFDIITLCKKGLLILKKYIALLLVFLVIGGVLGFVKSRQNIVTTYTSDAVLFVDLNREDTEADTDVFGNSQTSYHILEVSILGILLHTILIEVGNLSGDTSIKNKRQRIYIGIGSRVQIVDLVVLMKTKTHAIHTTIETRSLVRQYAKTILAVWRISTTLGIYHKSRTQQKGC